MKKKKHLKNDEDHSVTDLEGLDEGPQQVTDALWTVEQLDQTHDTEESEERDGNRGIFRVLQTKRTRGFDKEKTQKKEKHRLL